MFPSGLIIQLCCNISMYWRFCQQRQNSVNSFIWGYQRQPEI
ncbi:hypothetical protein H5410_018541 [Solanum commersonii]|uniref:Uncharacterized protein n=1 Tax=Solanum commersonii TaxID=4109 RepID=A0A9J6A2B7_SOLCO|nr:hypothetical protein H5410_018541 [Solanum commersonii]